MIRHDIAKPVFSPARARQADKSAQETTEAPIKIGGNRPEKESPFGKFPRAYCSATGPAF